MYKIAFPLQQDAEGWPPASVETLWAMKVGDDLYKIDNIPFFVHTLAMGDVVRAISQNEMLEFQEIISFSGHSTVRIMFNTLSEFNTICTHLKELGCVLESGSDFKHLTSVDVPAGVDFMLLREYLAEKESAGVLNYEESCISGVHQQMIQ